MPALYVNDIFLGSYGSWSPGVVTYGAHFAFGSFSGFDQGGANYHRVALSTELVSFLRGDVDSSGFIGLSDVIAGLAVMFGGNDAECDDTNDCDDNGVLNLSDTILLLSALFSGGPPPADPVGGCDIDPTSTDSLDGFSYSGCP